MNLTSGLQFFVLDISVLILGGIVLALCIAVILIYRRYAEQKRLFKAMERTVDRILKIESEGGIDGWEMAHRERQAKNRRK